MRRQNLDQALSFLATSGAAVDQQAAIVPPAPVA